MNKKNELLFTYDKKYYIDKNIYNDLDCFISSNLDELISYMTLYQPNKILFDFTITQEIINECFNQINSTYSNHPMVIFSNKSKILEILTKKYETNINLNRNIEIPIEIEKKLDHILIELNFSPTLKGYNFIKRSIFEGICNPNIFDNIEKNLYYKIADIFSTTKYSVERAINFSIKKAYLVNPNSFNKYFISFKKSPSNGKFLKGLLIIIKYKYI